MAPGSLHHAAASATAAAPALPLARVCTSSRTGKQLAHGSPHQGGQQQQRRGRCQLHAAASGPASAATAPAPAATSGRDSFDLSDWDAFLSGYKSCYEERSFWVDPAMVEGRIPRELEGTLLRNGPGLFEVGGKKIPQPFDGDGMLATFSFRDGRVFFANRYVRTEGFVREQAAQRLLYRGAFSVGNPAGAGLYNPFDLSVKGIANTGVLHWGGKLLALYERDLPYQLSTPELRTLGQTVGVPSQDQYFGAHYRITQEAGGGRRLVAFNAAERGQDNRVNVFEYDEQMNMLHRTELDLPGAAFGFFHDFLVTDNHYIFLESPMSLDLWMIATKYMLGRACIAECIKFDGGRKKTKVHLIPRPGRRGGADPAAGRRVFETEPFFSFHHANAFEVGAPPPYGSTGSSNGSSSSSSSSTTNGSTGSGYGAAAARRLVVLDTVANHEGVDFGANFETGPTYYDDNEGRGTLTRLVLDLEAGTVEQHRLMDRACEFPSVSPAVTGRPHAHVYCVGARFPDADTWGAPQCVVKVSLPPEAGVTAPCSKQAVQQDVYYPGRRAFAQEPIFVARPGGQAEDDGWVMALVYDAEVARTRLVILDAQKLSAGPVATITLPHQLPPGLHGSWTGAYLGPPAGEEHAPTQYDIRSGVSYDQAPAV